MRLSEEVEAAVHHNKDRLLEVTGETPGGKGVYVRATAADLEAHRVIVAALEAAPDPEEVALLRAVCKADATYIAALEAYYCEIQNGELWAAVQHTGYSREVELTALTAWHDAR